MSGRVVNTSIVAARAMRTARSAPLLRPIQLRCMSLIGSGQSSASRSAMQPVGVGGDAHHPLAQRSPEDGEVAPLAAAVGGDLLVGQHRAQRRAPVDRRLVAVGEPVRVDDLPALDLGRARPTPADRFVPGAGSRVPASSSASSSAIGRARSASVSYQALKICRKIHCVQR